MAIPLDSPPSDGVPATARLASCIGTQEASEQRTGCGPPDECHARSQTATRLMLLSNDSEKNAVCGIIADDALTAAAGDFTSKCVAGCSYSVAYNSFQYAATTYQVVRNVL